MKTAQHGQSLDKYLFPRKGEPLPLLPGWHRTEEGKLKTTLADGSTVEVFAADGWYWSCVAADGSQATYSRRFRTELQDLHSAQKYVARQS